MSKQTGTDVFVGDGTVADPSVKIGRRDTGFYITRPGTYDENAPARVRTVVAGVEQATVETLGAAPVDGAASTATVTLNPNVSGGDYVTVDGVTYTFVAALSVGPTVPYEVEIGLTANATLESLILAINGTADPTHTAPEAHPTVTAGARDTNLTTLTTVSLGAAGDDLVISKSGSNLSFTAFTGGIDGTPGTAGTIFSDGTDLFICLADGGITDSGVWKKITTGAL